MDDVAKIARGLSEARKRNLLALNDCWSTCSELRSKGATGAGLDVLHGMHFGRSALCERRWAKWGSEIGQKRGEGYEYRILPLGHAVRAHLQEKNDG